MKKLLLLLFFVSSLSFAQTPATALNFDGTNDYVDAGTDSAFDFTSTSTFTIEAWIKPVNTSGTWKVIAARESWNDGQGWLLHAFNGTVSFRTPAGAITTGNLLNDGSWNYVVVVYDASAVTIYVNEVSVASGTLAITNDPGQSLYIGARHNNAGTGSLDFLNGDITELRFWSTARTIGELGANKDCSLMGNEANLFAFYNFNQGFDNMDNSSETTLICNNTAYNGTLNNFALTGTTSNFVAMTGTGFGDDIDDCTLSINSNVLAEGISLYPNPARNEFTLSNQNNTNLVNATITDINGRTVSNIDLRGMSSSKTINISNLNSGLYLVKIQSNDASITKKLIVR